MKKTLLALALLAAPHTLAQSVLQAHRFDVDSTTYTCVQLCPGVGTGGCVAPGPGTEVAKKATTSGVAATTVTSVDTDSPFAGINVGDVVLLDGVIDATDLRRTGQAVRLVSGKASDNSITVDASVLIPTAGSNFRWWRTVTGTAATSGWFPWPPAGDATLTISADQVSATGGVDYKIEGRQCSNDYCTTAISLQSGNFATGAAGAARLSADKELQDQVRVCLKIGTSDADDNVVITASTDDIDFTEGVSGAHVATLAAATYTSGAAVCVEVAAKLNAVAVDNTYSCTFSVATGKITIARATGTATIAFPWITGPNTATSAKAALGFTADDTGATTYTADNALDFGDPASETEKVSITVRR